MVFVRRTEPGHVCPEKTQVRLSAKFEAVRRKIAFASSRREQVGHNKKNDRANSRGDQQIAETETHSTQRRSSFLGPFIVLRAVRMDRADRESRQEYRPWQIAFQIPRGLNIHLSQQEFERHDS